MKNNLSITAFVAPLSFLMVTFMTLSFSLSSEAWISSSPTQKTYHFKFKMNSEVYETSQPSTSYEEAFDKAAQSCFKHFKGGRRVSEDRGLDIIDVCANPRSS